MKFEFNDVTKKYVCNECGKEYSKNGIGTHYWRMHTEQGSKFDSNIGFKNNTRQIWNKGLTKDNNESVKRSGSKLSSRYKSGELKAVGFCSKEYLQSEEFKHICSFNGGYREKSGSSKGQYVKDSFGKEVYLQSSYEVLCSIILNELKIKWIRPSYIKYNDGDKDRKYYPDFYLLECNVYIDTKNDYLAKLDKNKIDLVNVQNNLNVYILTKDKINEEFIKKIAL